MTFPQRNEDIRVNVFGAGIAGLTAAQELATRGFRVTVYDRSDHVGGQAGSRHGGLTGKYRYRPFPDSRPVGDRKLPDELPSEHGFRFFPGYYHHIWDTMLRTPVTGERGSPTVFDNIQSITAQATTTNPGHPSTIFPRTSRVGPSETLGSLIGAQNAGYTLSDLTTLQVRIDRYLATCNERRWEFEDVSLYDYVVRGVGAGAEQYYFTDRFLDDLEHMPKVLAAFDAVYGDARTNIGTLVQLNMDMDPLVSKVDGSLNGPAGQAWFDPWMRHLREDLGVTFEERRELARLSYVDGEVVPIVRKVKRKHVDGPRHHHDHHRRDGDLGEDEREARADYYVVALDAPAAETVSRCLPNTGVPRGLRGYTTSAPGAHPGDPPHGHRDPYDLKQMGVKGWDRFQTLTGIQFFFDTPFRLVYGHIHFTGADWGLSAIVQSNYWDPAPTLEKRGYVSVLSVDIGAWHTKSRHTGKSPNESTRDELAAEVWRQIAAELTNVGIDPSVSLPTPRWYTIDHNIWYDPDVPDAEALPLSNHAPYLVPIVKDYARRPGAEPWNPQDTSPRTYPAPYSDDAYDRAAMAAMTTPLHQEHGGGHAPTPLQGPLWQARHGGYLVHWDSLVYAGVWKKTFTRMTTMEAACESGRHAVNAILDHVVYERSGRRDHRGDVVLPWMSPYGFGEAHRPTAAKYSSPAGDYCFIFDIDKHEPVQTRPIKTLDGEYQAAGLPHPFVHWGIEYSTSLLSWMFTYLYRVELPWPPDQLFPQYPTMWHDPQPSSDPPAGQRPRASWMPPYLPEPVLAWPPSAPAPSGAWPPPTGPPFLPGYPYLPGLPGLPGLGGGLPFLPGWPSLGGGLPFLGWPPLGWPYPGWPYGGCRSPLLPTTPLTGAPHHHPHPHHHHHHHDGFGGHHTHHPHHGGHHHHGRPDPGPFPGANLPPPPPMPTGGPLGAPPPGLAEYMEQLRRHVEAAARDAGWPGPR